jgi:hypothetical protein
LEPWGVPAITDESNPEAMRFHMDAARPRQSQEKRKMEQRMRGHRQEFEPSWQRWPKPHALRAWTDERVRRWKKR